MENVFYFERDTYALHLRIIQRF